jgi:hypothetical protein
MQTGGSSFMIRAAPENGATIAVVVQAADGVRFVAAGRCADDVSEALVVYIRDRCDDVLWPRDASRVRSLIEAGRYFTAIAEYFEHVGARWDEERLEIHGISEGQDFAAEMGSELAELARRTIGVA